MSANSNKINLVTNQLLEIGACWAISKRKFRDNRFSPPRYHIHPDASQPEEGAIRTFDTLDQILEYCKARQQAALAYSLDQPESALQIMEDFEDWLMNV